MDVTVPDESHFENSDLLYLHNSTAPTEPLDTACPTIVFASPDKLRYKEFVKQPSVNTFVMPPWSLSELESLYEASSETRQKGMLTCQVFSCWS